MYTVGSPPPGEAETGKETESADYYPVCVTAVAFIGGYMALCLDLPTQRPDIGREGWRYSIYGMTAEEWGIRNDSLANHANVRQLEKAAGTHLI